MRPRPVAADRRLPSERIITTADRSDSESGIVPEVIAAVDLGSNSFHMIVGELRHGQLSIIDRLRETVRLSEGLSQRGELAESAKNRAIECLSRFGERLRDMHAASVRAAGTNALAAFTVSFPIQMIVVATGMADRIFQRGDAELKLGRSIWVIFSWVFSAQRRRPVRQRSPPT